VALSPIRWSPFGIANSGVLERSVQFELSLEGYLVHQVTDGSLSAVWLFFNQSLASCRIKLENSPKGLSEKSATSAAAFRQELIRQKEDES
jgi:hypothetical protein